MSGQTRTAVRVLLLDPEDRLLLFEGRDLADGSDSIRYWFTTGGGVDPGESLLEAASRELQEETGQSGLGLVGPFHRYEFEFRNHGASQHQVEHFFVARTAGTALSQAAWTELEREAMTSWRWWSVEELLVTNMSYFPNDLADLVRRASLLV